jgi:hypothetical protein
MKPTGSSRERILGMGGYGAGKTNSWITIAQWYAKRQQPGRFHVIDTDATTSRSLEGLGLAVDVYEVFEWGDYNNAKRSIASRMGPDDWLVIDTVDRVWDCAQEGFSEEIFGKAIDEWFVEFRKSHSKGNPFQGDYGVNWQVINRMYNGYMGLVTRFPGHVYCATPAEPVQQPNRSGEGGDSTEIRNLYGRFGFKPRGQKNLGHLFHTVLLMADMGGDWRMTTVKDRNRERLVNVSVKDFALDYLVRVGGWTP